ncbi:MAG: peroxidase-related enzyme [Bacteroidota bacterium]
MSWIKEIPYEEASPRLKKLYDRVSGGGQVDNVLKVHSLRPHTLTGHMYLYKNVLHNSNNTLPKWFLETIGVYVSWLNRCDYCVDHHSAGLSRLLADEEKAAGIHKALRDEQPEQYFEGRELAALQYAAQLTRQPATVQEADIEHLRNSGLTDGEILEVNQVCSYFCYVNRTVLGLGVDIAGEIIGLSPSDSDDPDNWSHG